ncbi:MAG: hypothetical protein J5737_00350 [Bacteroidales bacterium]|nr:hypothetical protein [Bacteroidales bacterium]
MKSPGGIICCIVLAIGLTACSGNNSQAQQETLRYRFASQEEGRRLRLASTEYFDSLSQNDIDWKLACSGKTLEEFKAIASDQIQEFSDAEKQALGKIMDFIQARLTELEIRLPMDDEIIFIKSDMHDEGNMGGFTHKNEIYLSSNETEYYVSVFQPEPDYDADYKEYCLHFSRCLVAHEIFHCASRNDPQFRKAMYGIIGFNIMEHEIEFGPAVSDLLLRNPDVERYDNWAEFTIGGQKRRCALISVYPGPYAETAATHPDAHFFDFMRSVLVPLDEPDTMIPVEEATDFYDVIGHNTDYILAPEESLAENFCYLISFGFFGRYDHGIVDRKIHFIPYETPGLIRNMHSTLLKH